jgi:hypothetical protein
LPFWKKNDFQFDFLLGVLGFSGGRKRRKVEPFLCHYFTSGKRRLCHRLVTVPRPLGPMNEMNEPEEEVAAAVASFNSLKKKTLFTGRTQKIALNFTFQDTWNSGNTRVSVM